MDLVKVMTYNICHYNFDEGNYGFPAGIMQEKAANLKELFMAESPDIFGLQEDYKYVDAEHTIHSAPFLFDPYWKYHPEGSGSTIRGRLPFVSGSNGKVLFSTGRHFRKAIFRINGKRLLFISCHPTAHVGYSSLRAIEYRELFERVNAEEWDWCIVTGDFNTTEEADKQNLVEECQKNNFTMAIGTYLPWVSTYPGHDGTAKKSFDNILVGGNATIRSVKVLRDWYKRLYSDHVPVIAEIVLE